MRQHSVEITHIFPTPEFLADFDRAPYQVKRAIDRQVMYMMNYGRFPNSMNVHKAESLNGYFIGYVTRTKSHWRVLFQIDGPVITLMRLANHDRMDVILKELVK